MKEIPLANSKGVVLVDDEDYEALSAAHWHLSGAGYAAGRVGGRRVLMHRFLSKAPKGVDVDHVNRVKLDNRKENLRLCTKSQNHANRPVRAGRTSTYRGVDYRKDKAKWRSRIEVNDKQRSLGHFDTEKQAALAYDKAAAALFGEFARLNFEERAP